MKTTIKLTREKALTVEPCTKGGLVQLAIRYGIQTTSLEGVFLTPDQAAALIFGLEMALETLQPEQVAA